MVVFVAGYAEASGATSSAQKAFATVSTRPWLALISRSLSSSLVATTMTTSPLLLHGNGWRVVQLPDSNTEDGWGSSSVSSAADYDSNLDGEAAAASSALIDESSADVIATAASALRNFDAPLLRQLWRRPLPLLSLSSWVRAARQASGLGGLGYISQRLLAERPEWQLALASSSELLALWRHDDLWLLSPRDNYAQPVAIWRNAGGADPAPQRRLLAWNVDDTLLACCNSFGVVHILDARARLLHALPPQVWIQETAAGAVEPEGLAVAATRMEAQVVVQQQWRPYCHRPRVA